LQSKEQNSTVDVGYHYVALGPGNLPQDGDADGLPDYLEDTNNDGSFNSGDISNWTSPDSDGDLVNDSTEYIQGRNPRVAGTVPDTSGSINLQVYTPFK